MRRCRRWYSRVRSYTDACARLKRTVSFSSEKVLLRLTEPSVYPRGDGHLYCWSTYLSELDRQCSTECSFIDHATCVKPLIANFDPTESDSCLPGCLSDSFKQESIQYIRIGDQVRADETIQFTIEYNNLAKLVHEEEETYTAAKFQSDLGGAAGLILGLNTIMLLMLVIKGAKYILRSLSRLINRMWMRFQVNVAPFSRRPSVFNRQHATSPRSTWNEST